ncbi:Gamma-aminobutyric acid type B receptor subunit 2 [Thoreauomyces humboldtii]|nr:Gamma-aminobutyric acid type B receptor subunit 2 [Thoreauomyces humboldtii]
MQPSRAPLALCWHHFLLLALLLIPLASAVPQNLTYGIVLNSQDPASPSFIRAISLAKDAVNADPTLNPYVSVSLKTYDSMGAPTQAFIAGMQAVTEGVSGLIGEADSGNTETLALVSQVRANIPLCSGASTSPALSNKTEFPNFFRTIPKDDAQAAGFVALLAQMGWKRVAILFEGTAYGQGITQALGTANTDTGAFSIDAQLSFNPEDDAQITSQLRALLASGSRIILAIGADTANFAKLIKMAATMGLVGDNYVWVLSDALFPALQQLSDSPTTADPAVAAALKGALAVYPRESSGQAGINFASTFATGNSAIPLAPYSMFYYDCVQALVRAQLPLLPAFPVFNIAQIASVTYPGVTGTLAFTPAGDRVGDFLVYNYNGHSVSEVASIKAPTYVYSPSTTVAITFHSGSSSPPLDAPVMKDNVVDWTSPLAIVVTAAFGIMVVVILVSAVGIFAKRQDAGMRAASPLFCGLSLLGMLLVFLSEGVDVGAKTQLHCIAYPALLSTGFFITLCAVFVKQWRIYRIFENVHLINQGIRDKKLITIFSLMVGVQIILLVCMMIVTPLHPVATLDKMTGQTTYSCEATNSSLQGIFAALIFAYGGALVLVCTYLAIRTRNVYSAFNESKWIGLSVYNIILCGSIAIGMTYIGGIPETTRFGVRSAAVFFAATVVYYTLVGRLFQVLLISENSRSEDLGSGAAAAMAAQEVKAAASYVQLGVVTRSGQGLVAVQMRTGRFPMRQQGVVNAHWKTHILSVALGAGERTLVLFEVNSHEAGVAVPLTSVRARVVSSDSKPSDGRARQYRFEIRYHTTCMVAQASTQTECDEWVYLLNSAAGTGSQDDNLHGGESPLPYSPTRAAHGGSRRENDFGLLPYAASGRRGGSHAQGGR